MQTFCITGIEGGDVLLQNEEAVTGAEPDRILIINPNSSALVTQSIRAAIAPLQLLVPYTLCVEDIPAGPPGIQSRMDYDAVAPLVQARIAEKNASGYVIACFSDPGLAGARERFSEKIITGVGEAAVLQALMQGDRFGIIALSPSSIQRQRLMVRNMGLSCRYSGSRAVNATAQDVTDQALLPALAQAASALVHDGADVILTGCAGMACFRKSIEQACGRPVIDPVQTAVMTTVSLSLLKKA